MSVRVYVRSGGAGDTTLNQPLNVSDVVTVTVPEDTAFTTVNLWQPQRLTKKKLQHALSRLSHLVPGSAEEGKVIEHVDVGMITSPL
jgi:hypothetical protein